MFLKASVVYISVIYFLIPFRFCSQSFLDRFNFQVISYIVIYRVRHYGINEMNVFSNFVRQQKIFKFLKFFLNEKNLLTWIKDAWSTQFEMDYVETELLNPLMK
jgi:hypothetical protein